MDSQRHYLFTYHRSEIENTSTMKRPLLSLIFCAVFMLMVTTSATLAEEAKEEEAKTEEEEEPWIGLWDYILLGLMAAGAAWYFKPEKKEESKTPSYVIQPTAASSSSSMPADRGFVTKMRNSKRRLVVFYGSQTGTAEEFAGRLAKEGVR